MQTFWVFPAPPDVVCVGIKLSLPLVTTLIQFFMVTELIIQFLVSTKHSNDN